MNLLETLKASLMQLLRQQEPKIAPQPVEQVEEIPMEMEKESQPEVSAVKENREEEYLQIPNFSRQLPMKSPRVLKSFVDSHQSLIYTYILSSLRKAIHENLPEIVLFKLGESHLIAKVRQEEYETTLRMVDEYFLGEEEYEKVSLCRKLLNRLHVNRVIEDSKEV
jgi:hypothetical protein